MEACRCSNKSSPKCPSSCSKRTLALPKATTVPSHNSPTTSTTSSSIPTWKLDRKNGMHHFLNIWMRTLIVPPANPSCCLYVSPQLSTVNCQLSTGSSMLVPQEASLTNMVTPSAEDVCSTPSNPTKGSTTTSFPSYGAQEPPSWCEPPTGVRVGDSMPVSLPTWKRLTFAGDSARWARALSASARARHTTSEVPPSIRAILARPSSTSATTSLCSTRTCPMQNSRV